MFRFMKLLHFVEFILLEMCVQLMTTNSLHTRKLTSSSFLVPLQISISCHSYCLTEAWSSDFC